MFADEWFLRLMKKTIFLINTTIRTLVKQIVIKIYSHFLLQLQENQRFNSFN